MNPLSAIRAYATPEMLSKLAPGTAQSPTEGGTIPLKELQNLSPGFATQGISEAPTAAGGSFSNLLGQMVNDVNNKQLAAGDAVNGLLSGQNVSLHQAMIAMEEASVSFQLMVEVRNKLLESYQEIMRMQV